MSFPEKLLADDEEVAEHLHPHWMTLVPAVVSFFLVCAASGAAIAFLPNSGTHPTAYRDLLIAILAIALIVVIWLTLIPAIRWQSTHYVITSHRVLLRRGVLHHTGRDITLGRINDVSFEQSIWDRIVRSGSLTIESAGENGQEKLVNIPRADEIQQTLNRLVEADSTRRSPYGRPPSHRRYPSRDGRPDDGHP